MAKRRGRDTAQGKDGLTFEVDVEAVNRQLEAHRMTSKEARSAIVRGLRAAVGVISRQARQNLSGVQGKHGAINARPLKRFVRTGIYKDLSGAYASATGKMSKAAFVGMKKHKERDIGFTLRFFEEGTKERYTEGRKGRKIRYTGKIRASHFFSRAVTAKGGEAQAKLQRFIEHYIQLTANKRK